MDGRLLILASLFLLGVAYRFHGRWLARRFRLDDQQPTPAHRLRDGVDFDPAPAPVLMGHHFASIAGASPIVGPVLASAFGWAPVWIWILVGAVLLGAVHDFTSLVASLRHQGQGIGTLIEHYLGRRGKRLFLAFAWLTLLLVIAVFTLIVARTFVAVPAVATGSLLFMGTAVAFGWMTRRGLGLVPATVIGVVALFVCLAVGIAWPLTPERLGLTVDQATLVWRLVLLAYVWLAATLPVQWLLQPRDYLNSFLLYAMMAGGLVGVLVAGPEFSLPAFQGLESPSLGYLFPMLFVTVACGAISGFHSLVASGTTVRQLDRESHARPVAYGSMLVESLLAVLALVAAASTLDSDRATALVSGDAIPVFSRALAGFMVQLGLPEAAGLTFISLTVAAFALTSLDTATRLGRLVFEELARDLAPRAHRWHHRQVATGVTLAGGSLLLFSPAGLGIWPLFGTANQLLAALALLTVASWLGRSGDTAWFVRLPLVFMLAVCLSSLVLQIRGSWSRGDHALAGMALLLLLMTLVLVLDAARALGKGKKALHS
jgi:carbon starvation protein